MAHRYRGFQKKRETDKALRGFQKKSETQPFERHALYKTVSPFTATTP